MKLPPTAVAAVTSLLMAITSIAADSPTMPKAGDKAPLVEGKEFVEGKDVEGKNWKLSQEIGKKLVLLYFYPKDDTRGCTKEACGFRDNIDTLKSENVQVIGVSFDSGDSHLDFIGKYKLNFPLVADTDGKIADTYGVRMTGKSMARRVSFLIGLDGKIIHVTDSPDADTHLSEMKDAAAKAKS